jgi:hypothetical protein
MSLRQNLYFLASISSPFLVIFPCMSERNSPVFLLKRTGCGREFSVTVSHVCTRYLGGFPFYNYYQNDSSLGNHTTYSSACPGRGGVVRETERLIYSFDLGKGKGRHPRTQNRQFISHQGGVIYHPSKKPYTPLLIYRIAPGAKFPIYRTSKGDIAPTHCTLYVSSHHPPDARLVTTRPSPVSFT